MCWWPWPRQAAPEQPEQKPAEYPKARAIGNDWLLSGIRRWCVIDGLPGIYDRYASNRELRAWYNDQLVWFSRARALESMILDMAKHIPEGK